MLRPPEIVLPSRAADERTTLIAFLDMYRTVLVHKSWGLTREQLNTPLAPSPLTLAGLLKHMAYVEDIWFQVRFSGRPVGEPWASAPFAHDEDWELTSAVDDEPVELYALFVAACDRSRAVVEAAASLDDEAEATNAPDPGQELSLRWILVHLIEEYARHAGHADLLREALDGRTGFA